MTHTDSSHKNGLQRLNAAQREAVTHVDGPLLILAGAGSGKTSVMSHRIAYLIQKHKVPPSGILGLSFTNKAAGELKERVGRLLGTDSSKGLIVSTFHSLCVRLLRVHAERIGFSRGFTILDSSDQSDVLRQILRHIKIDDRKFDPEAILFQIGKAKQRFLKPEGAEAFFLQTSRPTDEPSDYAIATASAFPRYQEQLKTLNAMDFDDLLYYGVRLLEEHADVRDHYNRQFQHILVDEYQDTNSSQFRLLELLTQKRQNLCVVGDDDQSIYAWRGADPTHILNFKKHYPAAQVITLDQNYRSTTTILDAANAVIVKNKKRHPKTLWSDRGQGETITQVITEDDRAESQWVGDEIQILKRPWSDYAILYRSNSQSRVFEEALRMRKVSYKIVGGMSFLDRKEIKDVLCYWRLVVNPKDESSLRRVINWPSRGIGKTTLQTLSTRALERGVSVYETLTDPTDAPVRGKLGIESFHKLIHDLRTELEATPMTREALAAWGKNSLARIDVKKGFEEDTDDAVQASNRLENVEELANALGQVNFDDLTGDLAPKNGLDVLREYLTRMALDAKEEEKDKDESAQNKVTLMTLHGAKGLEFPVVFMVGVEEGFLPHKRSVEEASDLSEERRLCYVGITRARDRLYLTRARQRIRYGKPLPRTPSRYIAEIPEHLMTIQNESTGPDLSSQQAIEKHEAKVTDFLAQIRGRLGEKPK